MNAKGGCYCCGVTASARMDIDAALDELGMLSSVTESRKQYTQERMRSRSESALLTKHAIHPSGSLPPIHPTSGSLPSINPTSGSLPGSKAISSYQIVHLDTKYITGFTDTPEEIQLAQVSHQSNDKLFIDQSNEYRTQPVNVYSTAEQMRKMRLKFKQQDISARNRRLISRKRAKQPYEVPWRLTQSFQESLMLREDDIPESKSNDSSPIKLVHPESLTRSRSLDNTDFSAFFISENGDRRDIDNVTSDLEKLKFSDS